MQTVVFWRISGRVQGVGFRWYVSREARRLGLSGWVRNASDGSVEVVVAGAADSLQVFEAAVRRGPEGSVVSGFEVLESDPPVAPESPFMIHR